MKNLILTIFVLITIQLIGVCLFWGLTWEILSGLLWFFVPFYFLAFLTIPIIATIISSKVNKVSLFGLIAVLMIVEANALVYFFDGRVLLIALFSQPFHFSDLGFILHLVIVSSVCFSYLLKDKFRIT
ncbi:MAG TPA: hypothetical protein VIU12_16465 [Chryseolinea sp.]